MVDRFNRLFLRTLRALRDLRRYVPSVTVQNAAQVNIGGQQVNTTGPLAARDGSGRAQAIDAVADRLDHDAGA